MQSVSLTNKTIFITGAAGFIGCNLVLELLRTISPDLDHLNPQQVYQAYADVSDE